MSSRAPAEHTWPECRKTAVRAKSSATSRSASAKTMLGFLPPSSSATLFTVAAAAAMIARPVWSPPVNETRSTRGSVDRRAPAVAPAPSTRLPTPGGQAGLLEQPHQVDGGVRGQLAGLEHEGAAGGQARRDLPGDLEQRVVPRRDQAADADRLVDDPADDVGVAGVDDPSGVLGCHPAVVAEDRDHVGDVVPALDEPLAGVEGLHPRDLVGVALEQVGHPQQEVTALAGRGSGPCAVVERAMGGPDRRLRVLLGRVVDLRDERAVCRAADLAPASGAGARPSAVQVEIRHRRPTLRIITVAYVATDLLSAQRSVCS